MREPHRRRLWIAWIGSAIGKRNVGGAVGTGPDGAPGSGRSFDFRGVAGPMFAFAPVAALLIGLSAPGAESVHTVPYVPSASAEGHVGVVRIESRSALAGEVRIVAVDDAGRRVAAGRVALAGRAAAEFDAEGLESGDAAVGLTGTGPGEGDWRLEISTELDIEARAYARAEGFVAALHDAVLVSAGDVELPLFHPAGDARRSVLRLVNAGGEPAVLNIRGIDDAGGAGGTATVELGAWEARSYTAPELEGGAAAGLSGSLGDGEGGWRLVLSATRGSAYAVNLLLDGSGIASSVPGGMSRGGFHRVPLFPSASDGEGRVGLVRVVNRASAPAEVTIEAYDATDRLREEVRLSLGSEASAEFDSADLEHGNAGTGLAGSTGAGEGDWWLELWSGSEIEVLSYLETAAEMLSPLRGTAGAETASGMRYEALLLDGSGELRLLNAGAAPAEVRITGVDDAGLAGGAVDVTVAPWRVRMLTAVGLEEGGATGTVGALGAGTGSWRLALESDREIDVLGLARGSGGALSDVSRRGRPAGAPLRVEAVDAVASRADLWVAASASPAELLPGEVFELAATVGNRGGRGASATKLRYYWSENTSISPSDAEVGTTSVEALAAGAGSRGSVALSAPSMPGTYYYGVCADPVPEEFDTTNNCSAAVSVSVSVSAGPDLAVAAAGPDGVLAPGASFELRATVRNAGGTASAATTLRYLQSADESISTSDAEVGAESVAALAAGAASRGSATLAAPLAPGIHYYGACADVVPGESVTANNCSAAVRVTVGSATGLYGAETAIVNVCEVDDIRFAWGFVLNQISEDVAVDLAIDACEDAGASRDHCKLHIASFRECAAIILGEGVADRCGVFTPKGGSLKTIEDTALASCRAAEFDNCRVAVSGCNTSF